MTQGRPGVCAPRAAQTPRRSLAFAAVLLSLAVAGCTTTYERALNYTGPKYRLTSAELQASLKTTADVQKALLRYPIGTSYRGRRCGNTIGLSKSVLNVATGDTVAREPLASSAPLFTDYILASISAPGRTVERQARQASIRHDYCYLHGKGTYGLSRSDCDRDLGADMRRICHAANSKTETVSCIVRVETVEAAVSAFGFLFYGDNTHETCEYDGQLAPARDFVLTGSFGKAGAARKMLIEAVPAGADALSITRRDFEKEVASTLPLETITLLVERVFRGARAPVSDYVPIASLASLHVQAQDLLVYAPQVADIDGDGSDELVLVGVDRAETDREEPYGTFVVPVRFDANGKAFASAAYLIDRRSVDDPRDTAPQSFRLDRTQLLQQAESFEHSIIIGQYDTDAARELVLPSLGVYGAKTSEEQDHADVRVFDFDPQLRLNTRLYTMTTTFTKPPFQDKCVSLLGDTEAEMPEIYKRFQYRPMFFSPRGGAEGDLVFLYRDKCQDLWRHKLPWQATLIANRVKFGDLNEGPRGSDRSRFSAALSDAQAAGKPGVPTTDIPPTTKTVTPFLFGRWGRYGYPILELQHCGDVACAGAQRRTDWAAISLCNADGSHATPESISCPDWGANEPRVRPRTEGLVLTVDYDVDETLNSTRKCTPADFDQAESAPSKLDALICEERYEYEISAPEDFGIAGSEVTVEGHGTTTFDRMTSAFFERGSIVARVAATGSEGIVMLWPTEKVWRLLVVQPQGPGENPKVTEHMCDVPAAFAKNDMRHAPLIAVSPAEGGARDAILAVRRAAPGEGASAGAVVTRDFVYGGVTPEGETYRVMGGKPCQAHAWEKGHRRVP